MNISSPRAGLDAFDGSRRLNLRVLQGLNCGAIVVDERCTGKSITLLTHIAVRLSFGPKSHPIVVCETQLATMHLRDYWRRSFPEHPEPRWMGYRQFLKNDGLRGEVYLDEPREWWPMDEIRCHANGCGRLAGGVVSTYGREGFA